MLLVLPVLVLPVLVLSVLVLSVLVLSVLRPRSDGERLGSAAGRVADQTG